MQAIGEKIATAKSKGDEFMPMLTEMKAMKARRALPRHHHARGGGTAAAHCRVPPPRQTDEHRIGPTLRGRELTRYPRLLQAEFEKLTGKPYDVPKKSKKAKTPQQIAQAEKQKAKDAKKKADAVAAAAKKAAGGGGKKGGKKGGKDGGKDGGAPAGPRAMPRRDTLREIEVQMQKKWEALKMFERDVPDDFVADRSKAGDEAYARPVTS